MSGAVLVFIEHAGGEPDRLSLEAVALAHRVAAALGVPLDALVLGSGAEAVSARLGPYGVGLAHVATEARFEVMSSCHNPTRAKMWDGMCSACGAAGAICA